MRRSRTGAFKAKNWQGKGKSDGTISNEWHQDFSKFQSSVKLLFHDVNGDKIKYIKLQDICVLR